MTKPVVLTIAGSDSGGGAGIQADIKTITQLGGYAASTITAITAQNTQKVGSILPTPVDVVKEQAELTLTDFDVKAIKIGMVHSADIVHAVADIIRSCPIPIVLDPVMVSTSGNNLMDEGAIEAFKTNLLPFATIVTPNLPEMETISGETNIGKAAEIILSLGVKHVLIKGGHAENESSDDYLYYDDKKICFSAPRIQTKSTHGTGCTLSSAIATHLAFGKDIRESVKLSKAYVWHGLKQAPEIGCGNGPLEHKIDDISDCVSVKDHV